MLIHLPLSGTDLREKMGDTAHLVEILNPTNIDRLSFITENNIRKFVNDNWVDGMVSTYSVWIKSHMKEEIVFVEIKKNDSGSILVELLWNFTTGRVMDDGYIFRK